MKIDENNIVTLAVEGMDLASGALDNTKEMLKRGNYKCKINADSDNLERLNRIMEILDLIISETKRI